MAKKILQRFFLTEPELITGNRYLRWNRVAITSAVGFFLLLFITATLGNAESRPDYRNYSPLTADEISKNGVHVYSDKDINRTAKIQKHTQSSLILGNGHPASDVAQVISRQDRARSESVLPTGSRVPVILDGNLNSQLSQSPVIALIGSGFTFQGRTLLPAGTKILGIVGPAQGSERISVIFDQIVYPNGHQVAATGYAIMPDGSPGVVGNHHSGRVLKIAGAMGSSFLAGAAAALQTNQVNMLGLEQPKGSTRNAILNGVAQTTLEQGRRMSDEATQTQGYVTIPSGTSFQVYFDREVDLSGAAP